MSSVTLLGPQRLQPTLAGVVTRLGIEGRIAGVTAGWQEREGDDAELRDHLGGRLVNLRLHQRAEEAFARDPELADAHRRRQERVRELQELYRLRLEHALTAARALLAHPVDSAAVREARGAAIDAVRSLDAAHLASLARAHRRFEEGMRPAERPAVARHRAALQEELSACSAVAVAGGHVAVLLNRLRLFGLPELIGERPVLAWSAGAMVLAPLLAVFHDSPPQGPGNTEVLEEGIGLFPGILPLPHARRRLNLTDPRRVALLARRFGPLACLPLDEGAELHWDGRTWSAPAGTRRLTARGSVEFLPGSDALDLSPNGQEAASAG